MVVAALSVVSLILLTPMNYLAPAAGASPRATLIGCAIMGLWVIPYLLPAMVVRRPGAALIAGIIMGIICIFTTPYGPGAIVGNLLGALFIEIPLTLMLYRKWTWWSFLLAAGFFGLVNALLYLQLAIAVIGIGTSSAMTVVSVVSALTGAGVTLLLTRLLNRAGVGIDHRARPRARHFTGERPEYRIE